MKVAAAVALAMLGACDDGYDIRVTVTPTQIQSGVFTSGCAPSLSAGSCSYWSDKGTQDTACQPVMDCQPVVHLEKDGVTVAQGGFVLDNPPPADELVIDGCSQEIRVPLPAQLPAAPTITSWVDPHVEWNLSSPASTVTIAYGTSFTGGECAVAPATTSYELTEPHDSYVEVTAWLAPVTVSVSLGEAHVQAGASAWAMGSAD
jgi:hypothetical protein